MIRTKGKDGPSARGTNGQKNECWREGGKEDWWVEMDGWGVMGGTVGG